jgi:hypothetical protein
VTAVETRTDARRALLERLIDHAPLFPPASMSMEDALAEDARVRAADTGWIVGRFVCPASRLRELGHVPLRLSVVLDVAADHGDHRVEAVELPPEPPDLVVTVPEIYAEVPRDGDVPGWIEALARAGLRAKVRCGGARVPAVAELAAFVRNCRERAVPFKATAGLHHAVRTPDEHGFLNLLAAAVFGDEEEALADADPAAFALSEESFAWRGRHAGAGELARVREQVLVAIGSCSAQEPVDDLRALGLL